MFYFGYLAGEWPTNRLLQRLPLAKWSAFNVISMWSRLAKSPPASAGKMLTAWSWKVWGLVLACMAAVGNFSGAMAVRFLLGVFEAAVSPGFALFTSQWYTIREQGSRTGIWFR